MQQCLPTKTYTEELVSDLPAEYSWILFLVVFNFLFHFWGSNSGLRTTNGSRTNRSSFLVSLKVVKILEPGTLAIYTAHPERLYVRTLKWLKGNSITHSHSLN